MWYNNNTKIVNIFGSIKTTWSLELFLYKMLYSKKIMWQNCSLYDFLNQTKLLHACNYIKCPI